MSADGDLPVPEARENEWGKVKKQSAFAVVVLCVVIKAWFSFQ